MKNTYILVFVLVVLIVGTVFIFGIGEKAEAPVLGGEDSEKSDVISNKMPAINTSNTAETLVVKEFTVSGKNFSFTPSFLTVKKDDKVKIIFENKNGFHDFKINEFDVATKQTQSPATEVLEFTADKTGSFEYYCSVGSHRAIGMKGILKVE